MREDGVCGWVGAWLRRVSMGEAITTLKRWEMMRSLFPCRRESPGRSVFEGYVHGSLLRGNVGLKPERRSDLRMQLLPVAKGSRFCVRAASAAPAPSPSASRPTRVAILAGSDASATTAGTASSPCPNAPGRMQEGRGLVELGLRTWSIWQPAIANECGRCASMAPFPAINQYQRVHCRCPANTDQP